MKKLVLVILLAGILAVPLSAAYAWHCPKLAADAKALIGKVEMKGGDVTQIQQAKKLVDEGLALHGAGKHNSAMETLAEAIETAVHSVTHKKGGMSRKGYGNDGY